MNQIAWLILKKPYKIIASNTRMNMLTWETGSIRAFVAACLLKLFSFEDDLTVILQVQNQLIILHIVIN